MHMNMEAEAIENEHIVPNEVNMDTDMELSARALVEVHAGAALAQLVVCFLQPQHGGCAILIS